TRGLPLPYLPPPRYPLALRRFAAEPAPAAGPPPARGVRFLLAGSASHSPAPQPLDARRGRWGRPSAQSGAGRADGPPAPRAGTAQWSCPRTVGPAGEGGAAARDRTGPQAVVRRGEAPPAGAACPLAGLSGYGRQHVSGPSTGAAPAPVPHRSPGLSL